MEKYRAIISSDWNGCLAPCGPFDVSAFTYPELTPALDDIFKRYTGNRITLEQAMQKVTTLLPEPVTAAQMDAYLDQAFHMYTGVAELMAWCRSQEILFMVNTTGAMGYFQRAFFKNLLPPLPVVSAFPEPNYPKEKSDPGQVMPLMEITDKAKHTEMVAQDMGIPLKRIVIMGDSGGDGPHFKWGAGNGAFLIASMAKPSLQQYCEQNGIRPDLFFGPTYSEGEATDHALEMGFSFMDLTDVINGVI